MAVESSLRNRLGNATRNDIFYKTAFPHNLRIFPQKYANKIFKPTNIKVLFNKLYIRDNTLQINYLNNSVRALCFITLSKCHAIKLKDVV